MTFYLIASFLLIVCMCMCMSACMYVCVGKVSMHRCPPWMWEPDVNIDHHISHVVYLVFWDRVSPIRQGWIASETQASACSLLPIHNYTWDFFLSTLWGSNSSLLACMKNTLPTQSSPQSSIKHGSFMKHSWTKVYTPLLISRKYCSEMDRFSNFREVPPLLFHVLRDCPIHS